MEYLTWLPRQRRLDWVIVFRWSFVKPGGALSEGLSDYERAKLKTRGTAVKPGEIFIDVSN